MIPLQAKSSLHGTIKNKGTIFFPFQGDEGSKYAPSKHTHVHKLVLSCLVSLKRTLCEGFFWRMPKSSCLASPPPTPRLQRPKTCQSSRQSKQILPLVLMHSHLAYYVLTKAPQTACGLCTGRPESHQLRLRGLSLQRGGPQQV